MVFPGIVSIVHFAVAMENITKFMLPYEDKNKSFSLNQNFTCAN